MKMRARPLILLAFTCLPLAASAEGEAPPPSQSPGVVRKVGTAVEEGAQAAADGVKKGVRAATTGIERGAEAASQGVKAAAEGVERGTKATAGAVERVVDTVTPASSGAPAPVTEVPPPAQK